MPKIAKTQPPTDLSKDEGYAAYSAYKESMRMFEMLHDMKLQIINHFGPDRGHALLAWVSWCIRQLRKEDLTYGDLSVVADAFYTLQDIVDEATAMAAS